MLNKDRPWGLWPCLGSGQFRDYVGWAFVRRVRIEGRPATRYEVTIAEKHLRIILPMGGAIKRSDIGRKLIVDVYEERGPGEGIIDHIV